MTSPEPAIGQRWGLWVYDDAMYQRFTLETELKGGFAGRTDDNNPCYVGTERLRKRGDYLGEANDD